MFKCNKKLPVVSAATAGAMALIGVFLISSPVSAGLDKIDGSNATSTKAAKSNGKSKPTKVKSMARIPDKVAGSVFKCWQEGRLIYQRSGMDVGSQKLPGATKIKAGSKTLQVLDLKQGVCILDQSK